MSVSLYDKALVNKIKGWIIDPNLVVLGPDETSQLFAWRSDINNDKPISLPLVSLTRDSDITIDIKAKRELSYQGKMFNSDGKTSDHLNAIPITINYQLDIYTRYRAEADEYLRNFVFNFVNHPKMTIDIPYNDCHLQQDSFISLEGTVSDNSSIPERLIPGQFTRYSIGLTLNDAYLFSYNFKETASVQLEGIEANKKLYIKTPDFSKDSDFETII